MAKEELTFRRADEVADLAENLIPSWHPHLSNFTLLYVFRSVAAENKGKSVWGKARKISGLNAYLAMRSELDYPQEPASPTFFVIEIALDVWNTLRAPERIALVDHELSHIGPEGLVGHDVEEFSTIVARHGHWRKSLQDFADAGKQQPLFEAVSNLRPKRGSGIDKVTITAGGKSVDLTAH